MNTSLKTSFIKSLFGFRAGEAYPSKYVVRYFCEVVRVRFAPSPTGDLHLGGLRTALYNYLFARKNNGKFILRLEDTDQKRVKPSSMDNIYNMLNWTRIIPDESPVDGGPYGPYVQSQRTEKYKEKAKELLKTGAAYRCFCSEARLDLLRKEALRNRQNPCYDNRCRHLTASEIEEYLSKNHSYTIRFKMHLGPITFNDIVFGSRTFDLSGFEGDFIILKSDGFPTYHFACVIDDCDMKISHVLRGAEWLSSTTKHIMLYKAFGWSLPLFAHLPLLVNSDRTKLSKRQEALSVEYFKNQGYEALAVLNFLAGIGSGFGLQNDCNIFDLDELCSKFTLSDVHTNSCVLDLSKLDVYNHNYLLKLLLSDASVDILIERFKVLMKQSLGKRFQESSENLSNVYIKKILLCYKDRISNLSELLQPNMQYLWTYPDIHDIKNSLEKLQISKSYAVTGSRKAMKYLKNIPESSFVREKLTVALKCFTSEEKLAYVPFLKLLRIMLTGRKEGPGVAEILEMLGPEHSLKKLNAAVEDLEKEIAVIVLK